MDEIELVKEEDCIGYISDKREDCAVRRHDKRLSSEEKRLLEKGKRAIRIVNALKNSAMIRNEIERDMLEDGIAKANRMANERNRRLELIHNGHSVDRANAIISKEKKDAMEREGEITEREKREADERAIEEAKDRMKKRRQMEASKPRSPRWEKRVVCGKARSCELIDGNVSKVYDIKTKIWLPLDEFKNKYENIKADVGEEVKVEAPKIMVTTTTNGVISSGTTTMIPDVKANTISVPVEDKIEGKKTDDVKVDENKIEEKKIEEKKIENKSKKKAEHANIIDEYVSLLYMNGK